MSPFAHVGIYTPVATKTVNQEQNDTKAPDYNFTSARPWIKEVEVATIKAEPSQK